MDDERKDMTALDRARGLVNGQDYETACEEYEQSIDEKIDVIMRQQDTIDRLMKCIKISMDNFNELAGIIK